MITIKKLIPVMVRLYETMLCRMLMNETSEHSTTYTPLSHLQTKILELLSMDTTIYSGIVELAKHLKC